MSSSPLRPLFWSTGLLGVLASLASGQVTTLVSVDSAGNQTTGWGSGTSALSADGRCVAFLSRASNLVSGDTNGLIDAFVHDTLTGATERVNVSSSGVQTNSGTDDVALSADGNLVAFSSSASNLVAGDTNGCEDVFVRDRLAGTTERVSVDSSGTEGDDVSFQAAISGDGRVVAFVSRATNLAPGNSKHIAQVYVHDRSTGVTEIVSVDDSGNSGDGDCITCALSGDGRFVAFASWAANLVAGDTNGVSDVFVRDRTLGTTVMASVDSNGKPGGSMSDWPAISADGRCVAFETLSQLDPKFFSSYQAIYLRDLQAGTTEMVSLSPSGTAPKEECDAPAISADGRCVAFSSWDANFTSDPTNVIGPNVFLRDRRQGTTTWCSANTAKKAANGPSGDEDDGEPVALSGDGFRVAFTSGASDLVATDTNFEADVFLFGPSLTLIADPTSAPAGATMTFSAFVGEAGGPMMLVATNADGIPMFTQVFVGLFDANGLMTLSGVVPFGLQGHVVTLQVYGILPTGKSGASNPEVVTFQ